MRDPKRIDQMLAVLRWVWHRNPDLRLGQLVANAAQMALRSEDHLDVFYIEDTDLHEALNQMLSESLTPVKPERPGNDSAGEPQNVVLAEPSKFFHYSQNNSGGQWHCDEAVTHHVVIEADNGDDADRRAEAIGLYFDGCDKGTDCQCCGDRWHRTYGKGDSEPLVYGDQPASYKPLGGPWRMDGPEIYVYYKDGRKEAY